MGGAAATALARVAAGVPDFLVAVFDLPPPGVRRLESALAVCRGRDSADELPGDAEPDAEEADVDEPFCEDPSSAHAGAATAVPTPNMTASAPTRPT
jgi:hypothetical protein